MYLRFESGGIDPHCGRACGFFGPMLDYLFAPETPEDWLWDALYDERCWFNEHLDRPARFQWRGGRRGGREGVCWFKPDATAFIRHARRAVWLLGETGIPVHPVISADPGQIIWADDHQIVAIAR